MRRSLKYWPGIRRWIDVEGLNAETYAVALVTQFLGASIGETLHHTLWEAGVPSVRPKRRRALSEEQRAKLRENAAKARAARTRGMNGS